MPYKDLKARAEYAKSRYVVTNAARKLQYHQDDRIKNRIYKAHVLRRYGLMWSRYLELYAHGCWLCGEPFVGTMRPHVDHNHFTHEVRGLAHGNCNLVIGHAKESSSLLRRIATALEGYVRR